MYDNISINILKTFKHITHVFRQCIFDDMFLFSLKKAIGDYVFFLNILT